MRVKGGNEGGEKRRLALWGWAASVVSACGAMAAARQEMGEEWRRARHFALFLKRTSPPGAHFFFVKKHRALETEKQDTSQRKRKD